MHLISKDQHLCWKSQSRVTIQTGKQNKSAKMSGFPGLFLYGSQWEDRKQELLQEQSSMKESTKQKFTLKNKERGQGSMKCAQAGFCKGRL